jgi:hypothetical protein
LNFIRQQKIRKNSNYLGGICQMDNFIRYREPTATSSAFYSSPITNTKTKLPYMSSLSSVTKKAPASGLEEAFG